MAEKSRGKLVIASCLAGKPFGDKVFKELKKIARKKRTKALSVGLKEVHFANTEIKSILEDSIRGSDLYIIQDVENSVEPYSVNDNFMALKTAIDAARLSDAKYITAVIPVFPYARQDKSGGREGNTAERVVEEITGCGAERIITLDVHNTAIMGYSGVKFEDLHASKNLMKYFRKKFSPMKNVCIISPDAGGVKRANYFAEQLGAKLGIIHKERDYSKPNVVENITLLGNIEGEHGIIIDDILDTGGTLDKVARALKEKGRCKKIYFACSLPLLNEPAIKTIDKLHKEGILEQIITTDVVYHGGNEFAKKHPWFVEVSVAKYFAKVIYNINHYKSISALLK